MCRGVWLISERIRGHAINARTPENGGQHEKVTAKDDVLLPRIDRQHGARHNDDREQHLEEEGEERVDAEDQCEAVLHHKLGDRGTETEIGSDLCSDTTSCFKSVPGYRDHEVVERAEQDVHGIGHEHAAREGGNYHEAALQRRT